MTGDVARARALLRRGETAAAREAIAALGAADAPCCFLLRAELALVDGDLEAVAIALAQAHSDEAASEAERHRLAALHHLVAGQLEAADREARNARSACLRAELPPPPSLIAACVAVRLALDDLDGARALLDRRHAGEELVGGLRALLEAAWALRAGRLQAAIDAAMESEAVLASDGNPGLRALAAYLRSRAAHQLGALDRCERELRFAAGLCSDHQLTVVGDLCDVARMLLSATRGDWETARSSAQRLLALPRLQLMTQAEAGWSIDGDAELPPPFAATAALRRAERALADGDAARADSDARAAEQHFRDAGADYDRAFALVVRAEAEARLGQADRARHLLDAADRLAVPGDYRLVRVRAALVRASLGDRSGDLDAYVAALDDARAQAGASLSAAALEDACARVGLARSRGPFCEGRLWRDVVRRLELARPSTAMVAVGARVHLAAAGEWPEGGAVRLDLVDGVLVAGGQRASWPPHLLNLLALICEGGDAGLDAEQLYLRGWAASAYHPLRHRNTVYVAVAKLRGLLRAVDGASLHNHADGRYRMSGVEVAVRRALPARPSQQLDDAAAPDDLFTYAARGAISVTQARWELALRRSRARAAATGAGAAEADAPAARAREERDARSTT